MDAHYGCIFGRAVKIWAGLVPFAGILVAVRKVRGPGLLVPHRYIEGGNKIAGPMWVGSMQLYRIGRGGIIGPG